MYNCWLSLLYRKVQSANLSYPCLDSSHVADLYHCRLMQEPIPILFPVHCLEPFSPYTLCPCSDVAMRTPGTVPSPPHLCRCPPTQTALDTQMTKRLSVTTAILASKAYGCSHSRTMLILWRSFPSSNRSGKVFRSHSCFNSVWIVGVEWQRT